MKTQMQQTSLLSFLAIKDSLPEREQQVLDQIKRFEDGLTNREIAKLLGFDTCRVTGRTNSLNKKGLIYSDTKKIDKETNKLAMVYKVK